MSDAGTPAGPALWQQPATGLVGRGPVVGRAVDLVRQGVGVVIAGPRWSGRSGVLDAARRTLEGEGRTIRTIPAGWRWDDLLPGSGGPVGEDLAARLAAAEFRDVMDVLDPGVDVIVVDDLDELDGDARRTLRAALRRSGVPLLATRRVSWQGRGPVLDPGSGGPVVEVPLGPMSFEDLHTALEQRTGGPVSPALSAHLHRESAGLPGLAIALLAGAIAHGRVVVANGVWSGSDIWSPDMYGFFRAALSALTEAERDAAGLLARLGAVPVPVVEGLIDADVLDSLERQGLTEVLDGLGGHLVSLHPPALSTHLLHQPTSVHVLRQVADSLTKLDTLQQSVPLELGVAQAGARMESYLRPRVALSAHHADSSQATALAAGPGLEQTLRHEFSIALGAWRESHAVTDALRVLRLSSIDGRHGDLVESVLAQTDLGTAADGSQRVEFEVKAARWAIAQGRGLAESLAPLREPADDAPHRDALRLLELLIRSEFEALDPEYEAVVTPFLGSPDVVDAATARFVLAACHCLAGRYQDSLELLESATEPWPTFVGESAELVAGLCRFGLGQPELAIELATSLYAVSAHRASAFGCLVGCYIAALGLSVQGRLDEARDQLIMALPLVGGWAGLLSPERAVRGMLIYLSVVTYREQYTPGLVELVGTSRGGGDALPWGSEELLASFRAFSDNGPADAAVLATQIAGRLRARGFEMAADIAALIHDLLDADVTGLDEVSARVRAIGGKFLLTLVGAYVARNRRDATALVNYGYAFRELSRPEHAIGCFSAALDLFRSSGQLESAKRARIEIERLRSVLPQGSPVVSVGAGLTPREQEVASLASAGRSNAEIAAELHLSLRTVETHVRNIRRKTGARERSEFQALE